VPAINRRYDKTQLFYIWRHGRKRRVPIAKLVEPPIEVASSIPTGGLVKSANSEDHPAATAMKFLSDLRTGRAAAYNQCGTSRQLRGISIVARVYLKKVGWQFATQHRNLGSLKRSSRDHYVFRSNITPSRSHLHRAAIFGIAQTQDLGIAAHWCANA